MNKPLQLNVNGADLKTAAPTGEFLLDSLRRLGFTGAKEGCGEGECGACTVLVDGLAARACMVFSHAVSGSRIETIEGLDDDGELHPLQKAFDDLNAVQCGYCTPGLIMQAKELLERNPNPSEDEIRFALAGNLCRCTGYRTIVEAVRGAASQIRAADRTAYNR